MSKSIHPAPEAARPQATQKSHIAQRRVRWLSFTGVCSGVLILAISTALLNWHQESRSKANMIEAQVNEARLAMSQATVARNSKWTQLLSDSPTSDDDVASDVDASAEIDEWQTKLSSVQKIFESLNHELDLPEEEQLRIDLNPLVDWSERASAWNHRHRKLTEASEHRFAELDSLLENLLKVADEQRGVHRLRLAIGLRSHFTDQPQPIETILHDCAGSTLAYQMSGDLRQLRLHLSQLRMNPNVDELADIGQNQIRPLLLRLGASSEEWGESQTIEEIESFIFAPLTNTSDTKSTGVGMLPIQFALAQSSDERQTLVEEAAQHADVLDLQRSNLATAGDRLKNQYTETFARTLRTVWSVNLASGVLIVLVFWILTRRVSQDIAKQVDEIDKTANELANEKLLLASVVSDLPIPLYWKDESGRYQGCSRSFSEWMGFESESDVVGLTDEDLPWNPETCEHELLLDQSIMRYGIPIQNQEQTKTQSSGQQTVVLASKTPLRNLESDNVGLVGTYIDITERKAAEERLNGLAKIQAECPSEIYVFDTETFELLELNHAACHNLRVEEQDARGQSLCNYMQDANGKDLAQHLAPIISGELKEVEYEAVLTRADGTTYPVHVRTLTIEHDSRFAFVSCATDMTIYKQLESQLNQAQKLESIGQLATGIAHEINTPMQCICGNFDFLQDYSGRLLDVVDAYQELLEKGPQSWESRLDAINEMLKKNRFDFIRSQFPLALEESSIAASRVTEIVRAMRVMSHPGSQSKSPTNINELIQDASILSRNRWKTLALVELSLAEDLPTIDALAAELSQVFLNLIVNAADAIGEQIENGRGDLGNITIDTHFDDENIYVELTDDGPGMPDEVKAKVFEPFFTTKEVGKGTGQGLSITYDVVTKLHHGQVELQTAVGEGTTFRLTLPRQKQNSATEPVATPALPITDTTEMSPAIIG
ncbi:PAS domain-containing sensor histidine kinase [Rhodopirellula halodulae]|uniref:PAS domain-containing sensor histidine kinase n=1 Tax=Rhodopirellula halodulae TaxID=2894198 RepID=UPI001E2B5D04|nr:ATP-binding protein [Rhodopirellula sp. JC737]MCC9657536.1 PAS domain S-box protein [Rhodopirellula sp. JC737]